MKKYILIGCYILITACNMGTPAPEIESTPTATLLPLPIPATETPTIPPLPTDTPTLAPPPRFFTDEFDVPSDFWEFQQAGGNGTPAAAIENGALRIDIPLADTWYLGAYNAYTYSNVTVRVKISASAAGSMGLICRYDVSKGWFEFNIDSSGTYSLLLGQWLAPGVSKYIPIISDGSSLLNVDNVNSEIGLSCQENTLSLYANETLIRRLDVTNYGLTEGYVGISAASFAEPTTAFFEWLKISEE
ncbi:MAG: hypothetical protein JNM02_04760 [Anaerolineales bacterium]|nr:hypothetical protein [Anaerolineales bacterium]